VKTAEVSPVPTDDELAAIVAAIEAVWPRPVIAAESQNPLRSPTWRFSGRWWATPTHARRSRPFR
jgi:hypothetical protein